jgi:transcription termination factor NusB
MERLQDFVNLWNKLGGKMIEEIRSISNDLRFFAKVELTTASLELAIERAKGFPHQLLFELNQQRVAQVQRILEMALDLCKQATFEEQERLCIQIDTRCQDLSREIENSPTKLSIEELHPVIKAIQKKINASLQELYQSSTPRLSLRLPVESYTPDNNRQIEVQIVVDNRIGCSPAEGLELIVQEDEDFFILNVPEVKLDGSLRGGDQRILRVPIHVTEKAWNSQTFSLPVYVQYRMRSEEVAQTSVDNFSIRLYSEGEFDEI